MLWRTRARATLMHDAQIGVGERLIYLIPAMFARAPVSCSPRSAAAFGIFAIMLKCVRSEEHTSELQSLMRISYAVFCLTKKTSYNHRTSTPYLTSQHTT